MSIKHISQVLEHLEAKPAVKLVAVILADHANAEGVCWPSYKRIGKLAGMHPDTVKRHVRALIDCGMIRKLRTGYVVKQEGRVITATNLYQFSDDADVKLYTDGLGIGVRITP